MKPWLVAVARTVLIMMAGVAGLVGLFMSACGGILISSGGASILMWGLGILIAAAIFIKWLFHAVNGRLLVGLLVVAIVVVVVFLLPRLGFRPLLR